MRFRLRMLLILWAVGPTLLTSRWGVASVVRDPLLLGQREVFASFALGNSVRQRGLRVVLRWDALHDLLASLSRCVGRRAATRCPINLNPLVPHGHGDRIFASGDGNGFWLRIAVGGNKSDHA